MSFPTAEQVAGYLGQGDDPDVVALAGSHLPIVTSFVRAYVRGRGFDEANGPTEDLSAVIVAATARLTNNPEMVRRVNVDDYGASPAVLEGFTLPELAVLHLYRRRTA